MKTTTLRAELAFGKAGWTFRRLFPMLGDIMRRAAIILTAAVLLSACTATVPLKNPKTGEAASCGGEMWSPTSAGRDEHCLKYFHSQGFDPVAEAGAGAAPAPAGH